MCGRVIQSSALLRLAIVDGLEVNDSRLRNVPRRYNAAPSQELLVIRQNHKTLARPAQVGPDPKLVPRPERRPQTDQCQGRECVETADVQGCLRFPPLHSP
jgi:putative SOS response-associated peptidase YedK